MKKIFSLLLVLFIVVSFSACGDDSDTTATSSNTSATVEEIIETYPAIENNAGMAISIDKDTIVSLLNGFTKEQLRLTDEIYNYEINISSENYNDRNGCKVEAIPQGATEPERVFFIDGINCYVYDDALGKYVSVVSDSVGGGAEGETEASVGGNTPLDSTITFQYHEGNNNTLQSRFSVYDLSVLGMDKALSEYILVVTSRVATVSGESVSIIEVYEKDGTLTSYLLAMGSSADYYFDYSADSYVALN